jgi:DNA polymerase-3 subunit alpha
MGKKQLETMEKLYVKFLDGCLKNPEFMKHCSGEEQAQKIAEKIWTDWKAFASYAFNKSHSVCYAYVAYQTGYLKAHYPANFMCAQISSEIGNFDKMPMLVAAAADMGLTVLPPDINASRSVFSPEGKDAIRYGLGAIRGVGEMAGDAIVAERKANGPYTGLVDFCKRLCSAAAKAANDNRAAVSKRTIEALIRSGAMACFKEVSQGRLLAGIDFAFSRVLEADRDNETGQTSLFDMFGGGDAAQGGNADDLPDAPDRSEKEKLQDERDLLGVYLTGHPVDRYRMLVRSFQTTTAERFATASANRDAVRIAGILTGVRRAISKTTKKPWAELTVEDGTGTIKALAFNDAYEKNEAGELVAGNVAIADYATIGPNNEVYLSVGQAIAFKMNTGSIPASFDIGAKSITGAAADLQFADVNRTAQQYFRPTYQIADCVINGMVDKEYIKVITNKIFEKLYEICA